MHDSDSAHCPDCSRKAPALSTLVEQETIIDPENPDICIGRTLRADRLAVPVEADIPRLVWSDWWPEMTISGPILLVCLVIALVAGLSLPPRDALYVGDLAVAVAMMIIAPNVIMSELHYHRRRKIVAAAAREIARAYENLRYCPTCDKVFAPSITGKSWPGTAKGVRAALEQVTEPELWSVFNGDHQAIDKARGKTHSLITTMQS